MADEARPTPDQFLLDTLRAEVARLAAENVGLRQRLSDAEDTANSWREEATRQRGRLVPNPDDYREGEP